MKKRLASDAFSLYVALGAARSYEAVAQHFDVSKQAVVAAAKRDRWQDRLVRIERAARVCAEQRSTESLDEMNERHLRIVRALQGKALEALRTIKIDSPLHAIRALEVAVTMERTIRGADEPELKVRIT